MQRPDDRIPDRAEGKKPPVLRNNIRHSLNLDQRAQDRAVNTSVHGNGIRQSQGSIKGHRQRSSKEVILSPFRSVARRLSRNSWNTFREASSFEADSSAPIPFHNASTAPKPDLHEPEPTIIPDELYDPRQYPSEDDGLSDSVSEKYPPPDHDDYVNPTQKKQQQQAAVSSNFPVLVVQSLSKYTFIEDISGAELALRSLRNLSIERSVHPLLTKVGSIRATINAMERFFDKSPTILRLGLLFLGDISRESLVNKKHIGENGGLQLINRILLDTRLADVHLLERACITLRTICANCDYNAVLSGVCGTVDAILKTIRRWKRCSELQERSLDVLTTVVRDASENAEIAMDAGAASEVLSTIRQYPNQLDVQVAAARAACELARACEAAREDMGGAGLLTDLHRGMLTFHNNDEYATCAARCIRYLAFSASNRVRIARTPLASTLVKCLLPWRDERRVIAAVLQALANVTFDEESGKSGVVQGGGTNALLGVLETYAEDEVLCEAVCRVLRNASDGTLPTKRLVGRHACVARVARVIRRHTTVAGIQEHACATLINLWPTHEMAIRASALDSYLVTASQCHTENVEVMRQINGLKARLERPNSTCGRAALLCLGQSLDRRLYSRSGDSGAEKSTQAPSALPTQPNVQQQAISTPEATSPQMEN